MADSHIEEDLYYFEWIIMRHLYIKTMDIYPLTPTW